MPGLSAEPAEATGKDFRPRSVPHLLAAYLDEASRKGDASLFVDFVTLSATHHLSPIDLSLMLEELHDTLILDGCSDERLLFVDQAMLALFAIPVKGESRLDETLIPPPARIYLQLLRQGDKDGARSHVMKLLDDGLPVRELYLRVFQPAQYAVGELWQRNLMTVAQEHFCTAVTQSIMLELYPRLISTPRTGHSIVSCCVGRELHELGIRMVSDFFEMEGWDTWYLGAGKEPELLLQEIDRRHPDVVALSATMSYHIDDVTRMVREVKGRLGDDAPLIMVGGRPFNRDPGLWKGTGADLTARDAAEALAVTSKALIDRSKGVGSSVH